MSFSQHPGLRKVPRYCRAGDLVDLLIAESQLSQTRASEFGRPEGRASGVVDRPVIGSYTQLLAWIAAV